MLIPDAAFHPIRSVVRVLFVAPHWFITLFAIAFTTWFFAAVLDILPAPKHHPMWEFGVYVGLLVLFAIASWIARCRHRKSEYTEEQIEAMRVQRLAEMQRWLIRRLTADEVRKMIAELCEIMHEPRQKVKSIAAFDNWLAQNAAAGDELWFYDTGGDSWEHLHGEDGFAIVRNKRIVDSYMWMMN
jgi:hypothetical protein